MSEPTEKRRRTGLFALAVVIVLVLFGGWQSRTILLNAAYDKGDRVELHRHDTGFVTIDSKGNPSATMGSMTLHGGLVIQLDDFEGDKLVAVVQEKRWGWLPVPKHRSYIDRSSE